MEKDLENFLNKAKQIKLSNTERELIRGRLEEFVWQNPIKRLEQKSKKFYFSFITWRVGVAVFAFLLISGSAGASALATKALPGEKLYPMKVGVNEEIKTFFAFTDEAKAKVNADIAEVRLLEVEKLAEQGKLNKEKREELEREFNVRADLFEEKVRKIEQKDNTEIKNKNTLADTDIVTENNHKNKQKTEDLKNKFEDRLREREKALEYVRQKKNENKPQDLEFRGLQGDKEDDIKNINGEEVGDEEGEDEVEPILKEVRGRLRSKNRQVEDED